jgi:hypothetical protein
MYTKLANSILTSTVWMESNETRIVWLTLLAMCDKNGEVQASIPGLANVARVTVQECETAIELFLSPDPYSRTKEDEGRRIEEIDGGWLLLNHEKYRGLASNDDQKAKAAERQRRWRERQKRNGKSVTGVTRNKTSHPFSHTDTDTDTDTDTKAEDTEDNAAGAGPSVNFARMVVEAFNVAFGQQTRLTSKRSKSIAARAKDAWWVANWQEALKRAGASPFFRGANERGWVIDLDFFIRPDSCTRILEGKYDDRKPDQTTPPAASDFQRVKAIIQKTWSPDIKNFTEVEKRIGDADLFLAAKRTSLTTICDCKEWDKTVQQEFERNLAAVRAARVAS